MSGRINLDNMSEDFKSYIQGLDSQIDYIENNSYTTVVNRLEGESDDTQALQRAVNNGNIVYVNRDLTVSDTIVLKNSTIIKGNGKSDSSYFIEMTNDNKFLFEFLTDERDSSYDLTTGITFTDLRVISKNFIRLNNKENDFSKIGHIKGFKIDNCKITGKTKSNYKANTDEVPSYDELKNEGIGIQLTKVFDFSIRDSEIQSFGIGIDLIGSDIGLVDNCRLSYNDRHYNATRVSTYGSQCKIKNCDIMHNQRYGGIYLDNTNFDTIEDNYFECYQDSGTFIVIKKGIGCTIYNNRFDDTKKPNIPMCLFEPMYQFRFMHNKFHKSETPSFIQLLPTYIKMHFSDQFAFVENNFGMNIKKCPFVRTFIDESKFNIDNIPYIGGLISNSYPFEFIEDKWILKQTSDNCILKLKPPIKSDKLALFIETSNVDGTFHVNIRKNSLTGEMIYSGQISRISHIRKLSNMIDCEYLYFEFIANTASLVSLALFNDFSE